MVRVSVYNQGMQTLAIFNPEGASPDETPGFDTRFSVRAVMIDGNGSVALIHSKNPDYYTLPGGGVEIGEDPDRAVIRECMEETGYTVEIVSHLGRVVEVKRSSSRISQIPGYVVRTVGEKGALDLQPDEVEEGMAVVWVAPDRALRIFEDDVARQKDEHKNIGMRAVAFLRAAFPEL